MADRIAPRSGVAFKLRKGQTLKVVDPNGEQVCDLLAFSADLGGQGQTSVEPEGRRLGESGECSQMGRMVPEAGGSAVDE